MFGIGGPELVVIVVLGLILIGPKKFPQVAKTVGAGLRDLRRAANLAQAELRDTVEDLVREADLQDTVDSLRKDLDIGPDPYDWKSEPRKKQEPATAARANGADPADPDPDAPAGRPADPNAGLRPNDPVARTRDVRPRHPDSGLHFDSDDDGWGHEEWDDDDDAEVEVSRTAQRANAAVSEQEAESFSFEPVEGAVPVARRPPEVPEVAGAGIDPARTDAAEAAPRNEAEAPGVEP